MELAALDAILFEKFRIKSIVFFQNFLTIEQHFLKKVRKGKKRTANEGEEKFTHQNLCFSPLKLFSHHLHD